MTKEERPAPWAPLEGEVPSRRPRPLSPQPSPAASHPPPQQDAPWQQPYYALPKAGDARTGPLPLHPMSLSDILDGAFKLLKVNWRAAILVTATFAVPLHLILAYAQRNLYGGRGFLETVDNPTLRSRGSGGQWEILIATLVLGSLITFFVAAVLSKLVAASYLGTEETLDSAVRTTARRTAPLFAGWLLVHVLEVIALPFCGFPSLVVMTVFVGVAPAMAIEQLGPIRAMRRSARLMWPRLFPVMLVAVLCGVIVYAVGNALGTIPSTAALVIGLRSAWPLLALAAIVARIVATPIVAIVATLLYFDGRIRQEGFDIQLMADELARRPSR